jgi:hypothetical protein
VSLDVRVQYGYILTMMDYLYHLNTNGERGGESMCLKMMANVNKYQLMMTAHITRIWALCHIVEKSKEERRNL